MTGAGEKKSARKRWSDLGPRVISGVVLIVLGAILILSSGIWLATGLSLLSGGMMWELARLTAWRHPEFQGPRHPVLIGIAGGLTLFAMLMIPGNWALLLVVLPIVLGWGGTHAHERPTYAATTIAILFAGYALFYVREAMGLPTALWIVATVVLSDISGYFAGRHFGGPKLWPAVSPNKTWSGTVAGWVGAVGLALILIASGAAHWPVILLGPVLAMFGQAGDIAESWLKRRVGVKDSSNLIPGHGGLMDRFDAMSGAFLAALLFIFMGILPVIGG
ncbi:phosphatidate cytidylyltransferase [Paracoccus sp. DMF-8]|uniref:phosphatidate cytidylyltransferase n=1 Tax=Paracoccus sp. DMF-8 TaxID=3019445 RepID=UPI0023E7E92D|nr:phosphatidate cytidylyltransferase [Paracoccus sp. DMF-8]MDF3606455.1 phosphatidate cytidylyltransferase [Paracoccus sp. DMF-8]